MNDKPLVSFCILTYNQEKIVADAVNAALAQTYSPMEIIISDDCSTDKTFEIIEEIAAKYKGPHKVVLNKNKTNLGIRENCNHTLYNMCSGEYILLGAGDDVSDPDRAKIYADFFDRFPNVMSISCLSDETDENLNSINKNMEWDGTYSIYNLNDYMEFDNFIIYSGDSRGLRRNVIESFPPLKYSNAEDIYLFIRSLFLGSGCYIRMPLVRRRNWGNNVSSRPSSKSGISKMKKQIEEDVEYAYNNGIISEDKYNKFQKKLSKLLNHFNLYTTSPLSGPRVFLYRVMRKLFDLVKY